MDEMRLRLPFMSTVGLVMTYRCQIACPHCIIEAGPKRKEEVSPDKAATWIRQIANYGDGRIKVLALTGGEPFYDIDNLKSISSFAESCGLMVSVVTNAFWAITEEEATKTLRSIPAIKMISFSSDVYHQESIPVERVKNATNAAKTCDIPHYISITTDNKNDGGYIRLMDELKEFAEETKIVTVTTFPAGRALKNLSRLNYEMTDKPPIYSCTSVSSPIIFPDGRVVACIGPIIDLHSNHPLLLGDLNRDSLEEILDRAETNSILQAIRIWGPRRLVSLIKGSGPEECLPSMYVKDSICVTCYRLMSDSRIVEFLIELSKDSDFSRKVAYARAYYLHETGMLERLGLIP